MPKALVFANGDVNDGEMVRRFLNQLTETPQIIAADGGARVAAHYGFTPDTVIGDMDSIKPERLAALEADGATIVRHRAEKDETDLELALLWAAEHGANPIVIIGGIGGRIDQTIANIYLLALPELADVDVKLVAGAQSTRVLRAGAHTLHGQAGDTLSLIPVGGDVCRITTTGLFYPLTNEDLVFGPARGVSNVFVHDQATIAFDEGILMVVHTAGKAE